MFPIAACDRRCSTHCFRTLHCVVGDMNKAVSKPSDNQDFGIRITVIGDTLINAEIVVDHCESEARFRRLSRATECKFRTDADG